VPGSTRRLGLLLDQNPRGSLRGLLLELSRNELAALA
jgi:hypothetical protein